MRVLHVLNTGRYSGAENVVITLINAFANDVGNTFAYTSPDGPIREILKHNNIYFMPIEGEKMNIHEFRRVVKEFKPDIIHTHDYNAGIVAAFSMVNVPIVNHLHNNTPWMRKINLKSIVYGLSTIRYKKIFMVSEAVKNEYVFKFLFGKKSELVGNPLNLDLIRTKSTLERLDFKKKYDVVFLGRLDEQKRPILFLEIIKALKEKKDNITAIMIGTGPLSYEVNNYISENELDSNVELADFQENPYNIVANCRIMCMPSAWEGFGLSAVEALCLGKPVVAAPVGGLKNIVTQTCGMLCDNVDDFVNEIDKLLNDNEYYGLKSRNAVIRADQLVDLEKYKNTIMDGYSAL